MVPELSGTGKHTGRECKRLLSARGGGVRVGSGRRVHAEANTETGSSGHNTGYTRRCKGDVNVLGFGSRRDTLLDGQCVRAVVVRVRQAGSARFDESINLVLDGLRDASGDRDGRVDGRARRVAARQDLRAHGEGDGREAYRGRQRCGLNEGDLGAGFRARACAADAGLRRLAGAAERLRQERLDDSADSARGRTARDHAEEGRNEKDGVHGAASRPGWLAIGREPIHSKRERVRPIRRTRLAWHAYTQRGLASQPGDGWQKALVDGRRLIISRKCKWGAERDLEETARGRAACAQDLHLLQARRKGQGVRYPRHAHGFERFSGEEDCLAQL